MNAAKELKHSLTQDTTLVANLKQLMHEHKINEADLSRSTGIPQPTLHKILSRKTADPRISTLKVLAQHFNISLDHLCTELLLPGATPTKHGNPVPIISWETCLTPESINHLTPANWDQWLVVENDQDDTAYALMTRACMVPRFPKDTLLIINPAVKPIDGDLIVVHYPDTTTATLRELMLDGPTKLLIPLNREGKPENLTDDIKIVGVVAQSRICF